MTPPVFYKLVLERVREKMVENSSKKGSKNGSRAKGDAWLEIRGSSTNPSRKGFGNGVILKVVLQYNGSPKNDSRNKGG